jgi:predicted GNAT superfamily acetyltransferase
MNAAASDRHAVTVTEAPTTPAVRRTAWAVAESVAQAGGFTVREVREPGDHRAVEQLLVEIWETGQATPPMPGDILRMLSYTGAYVGAAHDGDELIGAAVGFLTDAQPDAAPAHLHSHIAGVAAAHRGRQVGFALKLHQRAWALQRGFDRISWTFDPLVRRNAYFNLAKLGAEVSRYLVDFYGDMSDGINAGQGSDRILVEWRLPAPAAEQAIAESPGQPPRASLPARVVLRCGPEQQPQLVSAPDADAFVCEVPADIELLRRVDPELGRAWRRAVRGVLQPALAAARRAVEFDRERGYVVHPETGDAR